MPQTKPHVLFVLTSHDRGWYLPEFAHPYEILAPYCNITVASHAGGEAPLDQSSIKAFESDESCVRFVKTQEKLWKNTSKLEEFVDKTDSIDCIFYVGGYGPMMDIVDSEASAKIITKMYQDKKLLSAICHGPAVFAKLKRPGNNSKYLLEGHRVTGVSNAECDALYPVTGIQDPWSVQDELVKATDGQYEAAEQLFTEKVVVSKGKDGRTIITGQQPASGFAEAKAIYAELFGKPYPSL